MPVGRGKPGIPLKNHINRALEGRIARNWSFLMEGPRQNEER